MHRIGRLLLLVAALVAATASAHALPTLPGDLNLDGGVDVTDVQCAVLALSAPDGALPACLVAPTADADLNCDGSRDVLDVQLSVLLGLGNPLSGAVDLDGDARADACDPDRDGDGWSDACEAAAGTSGDDPGAAPASADACPGEALTTACVVSGTAGEPFRCDVLLAAWPETLHAGGLGAVLQVDPDVLVPEGLDLSRACSGGACTWGDPAPPATGLPGGQELSVSPACDIAPCDGAWADGKLRFDVLPSPGTPLTGAVLPSPGDALVGDAFVLSLRGTLAADTAGAPVELMAPAASGGDGGVYPVDLLGTADAPALVTAGPPDLGDTCSVDADCSDQDPCTTDSCSMGTCFHDPAHGGCDDGDACTTDDYCLNGTCTGLPRDCDDGLGCTADACVDGACTTSLEAGWCVAGGACTASSDAACRPDLVLTEVAPDHFGAQDDLVEVTHVGAATVQATGATLVTAGGVFALPDVTLAPGDRLVVHTGAGTDAGLVVHAAGALGDLSWEGGDVLLRLDAAAVDYVAWGGEPWASMTEAASAGLWPDQARLEAGALVAGESLQSEQPGGPGTWLGATATPGAPSPACSVADCAEVACADAEDNDLDGALDCDDADCAGLDCGAAPPEVCDDGLDNDEDGFADCLDVDCADAVGCESDVRLTEVLPAGDGTGWLELTNRGNAPADLGTLRLCDGAGCAALPAGHLLMPGTHALAHVGAGTSDAQHLYLGGALGPLEPSGGEVALSTDAPPTAAGLVDYVRWGEGSPAWLDAATAAGLWTAGDSVQAAALQGGDSLALAVGASPGADGWDVHVAPSPLAGAPSCGTPGTCRESRCGDAADDDADQLVDCEDPDCSSVAPCVPRVVLHEVVVDAGGAHRLELANLGGGAVALDGWGLAVDAVTAIQLPPDTLLPAGAFLVLHAGAGTDDAANLYGLGFDLAAAGGEVVLARGNATDAALLEDYVRWGAGSAALEASAVEAGEWQAGTSVDVTGYDAATDALAYDGVGDTAADWLVAARTPGAANPVEYGNCTGWVDDDGDGLTDCLDDDCADDPACQGEICGNGLDDDLDGQADCADSDCGGTPPCLEAGQCGDGVDNDLDGATDCADAADCAGAPACDEASHCDDGVDNDLDGATDCADAECGGSPACMEAGHCDDGADNDGDGLVDCEQTAACGSEPHCLESGQCGDGVDNDLDGATDCADADCAADDACTEVVCDDLVDNDHDGATDCADDDCALLPVCVGADPILVIQELVLDTPSDTDVVEVANAGPATGDLGGMLLCVDGACYTFPAGTALEPTGILTVTTGDGVDGPGDLFAGAALGDPSSADGEAGLYLAGPLVDPANVVDWVQWGAPGHAGEDAAVAAGQWLAGEAVPSHASEPGVTSYIWLGSGDGAAHWAVTFTPSPGQPNPDCSTPGSCAELRCDDGADDDGDGFVDCVDGDCMGVFHCTLEAGNCDDGLDNDSDGAHDCADSLDCGDDPYCDEALHCGDGQDNDLDGALDCDDADCTGDPACTESGIECGNGLDDDGDGPTDCGDSDCAGASACVEAGLCADGRDNDVDGAVDCDDADCAGSQACEGRALLGEVGFAGGGAVEIVNPGLEAVDVGGWWVCARDTCVQLAASVALDAGDAHLVRGGTGTSDGLTTWAGADLGLSTTGSSARLYNAAPDGSVGALRDFVQWGTTGQPGEAEAVSLGYWTAGAAVPMETRQAGDTLGRSGVAHLPGAWTLRASSSLGALDPPCNGDRCRETWCGDTVDNDRDGVRDCADPSCAAAPACADGAWETACGDGLDGDADGLTDCADPDCAVLWACAGPEVCDGGVDEDLDGAVDCADPDCAWTTACTEAGACGDGVDNDVDGRPDCADPECAWQAACQEAGQCADGVDDDRDGATDCADTACLGDAACPESGHCADTLDNDLDGQTDCADADCAGAAACDEAQGCDDGLDNDSDGLTDCSDDACWADAACDGTACTADVVMQCGPPHEGDLDQAGTADLAGLCGVQAAATGVMHRFTAGCTGMVTVQVEGDPSEDLGLLVVEGRCHSASTCAAMAQGAGGAAAEIHVTGGVDYHVFLGRTGTTGTGQYSLSVTCGTCTETTCDDGVDNDGNGLTDCAEPSCAEDLACVEGLNCTNGVDDDGDGATDCADDQCAGVGACDEATACGDGADQDLDGLIDCADPDCPHYAGGAADGYCDASETPAATGTAGTCGDGVDNDGDGLTDCLDPDCGETTACRETGACATGLDEDDDGVTDCSDSDCLEDPACTGGAVCSAWGDLACGQSRSATLGVDGAGVLGDDYCGYTGGHQGAREVVYQLEAPCDGTVRLDLAHADAGVYDMAVLEGRCDANAWCGGNTWVAPGDAQGPTALQFEARDGVPYFLVVEGYEGTAGAFEVTMTCLACPERACGDALDNDGDGAVDCGDPDCSGISPCASETVCDDQVDDDQDGLIDCDDPDCAGVGTCAWPCAPRGASCGAAEVVDPAEDAGLTDVMDAYGCGAGSYAGAEGTWEVTLPDACTPTVRVELTRTVDVGQGSLDIVALDPAAEACEPSQCLAVGAMDATGRAELTLPAGSAGDLVRFAVDGRDGFEAPFRVAVTCCGSDLEVWCTEGVDDDGDGLTDCDDPDCSAHHACQPEGLCDDGLDDEGDGLTDCDDPDCALSPACFEQDCGNTVDDDGDGLTDCDDPDCQGGPGCVLQCEAYDALPCGTKLTQRTTAAGTDLFDAWACDPAGTCDSGAYTLREKSFLVRPHCSGTVGVTVTWRGGTAPFHAFLMAGACDPAAQTCADACPDAGHAGTGTDASPATVTWQADAMKAYWIHVEPDAVSGSPAGGPTEFDIEATCTCP